MGAGEFEDQQRRPRFLTLEDIREKKKTDLLKAHQTSFDELVAIIEIDEGKQTEPDGSVNHRNGSSGEAPQNANN